MLLAHCSGLFESHVLCMRVVVLVNVQLHNKYASLDAQIFFNIIADYFYMMFLDLISVLIK